MSNSNTDTQIPSTTPKTLSMDTLKNTGLINLTEHQRARSIYVSNISSKATIKQVSDFFSFCGSIEKLVQDFDSNSDSNNMKQFAVVVFESDQSYSIALLLGNSMIDDSAINVHPFAPLDPTIETDKVKGRSALAVVTQLTASGFIVGETIVETMKKQALELDAKTHISDRVKFGYDLSIKKCKEADENYKFTETFAYYKDKMLETYKGVDEQMGIGNKAKEVKDFTVKTVSGLGEKAMTIEPIKQGVDFVSSVASSGWGYLKDSLGYFAEETKEEIKSQKTSKAKHDQPVDPTVTDAIVEDVIELPEKEVIVQDIKVDAPVEAPKEEKLEKSK
jgi:hypothetical protein